jgi:PAS domain S-box-containing protein
MISREITEEKKIEEERQKNLQRSEETKLALYNILEDAKESERVLQEERDLSQTIISSMGECLVVMTGDFKVVLMNQKASEIIGISPEEAVGLDYRDLVQVYDKEHNNLGVDRPIERVFENHELVSIELEDNMFYKCLRNNRYFPVIGVATPLKHIDGNMAIMVFQDATKIKALDEAKSSFISVASHQLRTPLTSIRWYVEMLSSNDANNLNEEQKDFVERAYHNVLKLSETINLLLNMARVESGKSNNDKSAVKLDNLVKEVIKEQDPAIKQKNLSVNITNNVSDLPTVNIDAIMLRQVIGNLISNSIRYTDKSGIIEVEISKNDIELVCSVKDNGIGIPEAEKGKIFDKFFRATNAVSKVPDGSGLGLSLVKALVESFRGKLSFESPIIWKNEKGEEIKRGTKFTFTIPLN